MRTLLTRPLHALIRLLLAVTFASAIAVCGSADLPRPIGPVSDYGAVLDRHGRDRLDAQIEALRADFGVTVYLLATWESALPSVDALAEALLASWGLEARGSALLAVFLKTGDSWTHALVATRSFPLPDALPELSASVRELVNHGRIEEAMIHLLDRVRAAFGGRVSPGETETVTSAGRAWLIPIVLAPIGLLIWGIHRRVCPRCGRILRLQRAPLPGTRPTGSDAVYFCRSCGFRRQRRRLRR